MRYLHHTCPSVCRNVKYKKFVVGVLINFYVGDFHKKFGDIADLKEKINAVTQTLTKIT